MRVIILYNKLFHYRIPVWNLLAEKCDLTVAYSLGDSEASKSFECKFKVIYLPSYVIGKRLVIQKSNIRKLVKDYDVVVAYGDIAWLKYSTLPWFSKIKVVFHTLGVSASYTKKYDSDRKWDRIRAFFYRKASALAFYTDYPILKYKSLGIAEEKMFVAPNTVYVSNIDSSTTKDIVLMVGTLYREKGVQVLLDAYDRLKDMESLPNLIIIGSGPDYGQIKKWVEEHDLSTKVILKGPIYDINEKSKYFSRALACISPKQAGLTVLESMGYGVPFITTSNAITGGEISNIHDGIDGLVLKNESEIVDTIKDISDNRSRYLEMGAKAKEFYDKNRTIYQMANGLWDAIMYAKNS